MQSRLAVFDSWGNRLAIVLAVYSAVTGIFSWLSSIAHWSGTDNWAGAVLIGFLFASGGLFVAAAALAAWRYFRPLTDGDSSQSLDPPVDQEQDVNYFHTRFKQLDDVVIESLWERIRELDQSIRAVQETTEGFMNLTDSVREVENIKRLLGVWDRELLVLLDWATGRIARLAYHQMALEVPKFDEMAPSPDHGERAAAINEAHAYISNVRSATNGLMISFDVSVVLQNAGIHAEQVLRSIDPPHQMHALDFKDYYVTIFKSKSLAIFLEERARLGDNEEAAHFWSNFREMLNNRQTKSGDS
jgi:hypothetical protein